MIGSGMNIWRLVVSALLLSCVTVGTASADDCGMDLLGLCKAARNAGKEAAMEFAKGLDVATLNARELTNQFGALVADANDSSKPQRQARARAILEAALGRSVPAGGVSGPPEYSIRLVGAQSASLELDSILFAGIFNEGVTSRFDNDVVAFQPQKLNGNPTNSLSDEAMKERLREAASNFLFETPEGCLQWSGKQGTRGRQDPIVSPLEVTPSGGFGPGPSRAQIEQAGSECRTAKLNQLVKALTAIQDIPGAYPVSNRHTASAPGGVVAILAPRTQLTALSAMESPPKLELWVHEAGKPLSPVAAFRDPTTKAIIPLPIALSEFGANKQDHDKCIRSDKPHGDLCFVWARLNLEAITAYEPASEGG